jgi:hypothetical protein
MIARSRSAAALLLAAATGGGAANAEARRRSASVIYATSTRVYLSAGARDGLAPGQVLQLQRGTCRIEQVSETRATCLGPGRPGDTVPLPVSPSPPTRPRRAALPSAEVLEQRSAALASAPHAKVDFHGGGLDAQRRGAAEVGVAHTTWWTSGGAGAWHRERADAFLRSAPIGGGFTLDLDLSARRWSRRADPISFRPEDRAQLYVWEASISRRPAGGGPAFSVGRVRPYRAPGQVILDGAQAGFRTAGGNEAGVFGGVVPAAITLEPSFDHGTFGGYFVGQHVFDAQSTLRFFRHEARIAFVNTAELGQRVEGEGLLEARITRRIDVALDVRAGANPQSASSGVHLDAFRLDGAARPFDSLSLSGSFRYEGLSIPELDGPGHVLSGGAARHADAFIAWEPIDWLRATLLSGLSTDLVTLRKRGFVGPEMALPRLAGDRLGLSAGYLQESGWEPGNSAYVQLIARSRGVFQILTRFSWFRTRGGAPVPLDEYGLSAAIQAQLGPQASLRVSALGRTCLNGQRSPFGVATGQMAIAHAEIGGAF